MKLRAVLVLFVALSLTGCSLFNNSAPQALPTVVLDSGSQTPQAPVLGIQGGVIASGFVIPAQQAQVAFASGGLVEMLDVALGDQVRAGQVLVKLSGGERLAAAVEAASLEVLAAQQALADLSKDLDVRQAEGLNTIVNYQEQIRDVERRLRNLQSSSQQVDIDAAYANMILARDKLDRARENYEPYENKPENNVTRAGLLSRLAQAQKDYDALVRQYNNLLGVASDIDISKAQAELANAQAGLAKAQRDYASLLRGPDPEAVALGEQRLATAQAQLAAAEAAVDDLELRAPFDGTVTRLLVHTNEWVTPGLPVLMLSDLARLRVETSDLSERDIPRVRVGQPVTVMIDALGMEVSGVVSEISPLADTLGGDVVYKATIDLEATPEGLRAGMSVEVRFGE